ncbi:MAG: hypothetical protein HYV63_12615 [Candidatus Schekmanbacteria bacterium]|nr:hypothetical protein [Candidatus Schekmanbacteria bacterium]
MWKRREIESYLCTRTTLLAFAEARAGEQQGPLFAASWRAAMEESIREIEAALTALDKPDPWGPDLKVSDEFLDPLLRKFFQKLRRFSALGKTDFYLLVPLVPVAEIDGEVREKLDAIAGVAARAVPRGGCA